MCSGSCMPTCTSFWLKCLWVDVDIHVNLSNVNVLRPMFVGKNNFKAFICTPLIPVTILSLRTLSFDLGTLSFRAMSGSCTAGTGKLAGSQKPGDFREAASWTGKQGAKTAATRTCAPVTNTVREVCVSRQTGGQTGSAWACQNPLKTLQKYVSVCWENALNF